jgi:hypothetical protein
MGCHFCADEMFAAMAILTSVRYVPQFVRGIWARRHKKPVCQHDHDHKEG